MKFLGIPWWSSGQDGSIPGQTSKILQACKVRPEQTKFKKKKKKFLPPSHATQLAFAGGV